MNITNTWYRLGTREWVVESSGSKDDVSYTIRYSSRFKWHAKLLHWIFINRDLKDITRGNKK